MTTVDPILSNKRKLSADLKQIHRDSWNPSMKPTYDERGFASVMITRFDAELFDRMTPYPIHFLELHPQPDDDPVQIRQSIPVLLHRHRHNLEWIDIRNTASLVDDTEHMRDVLPCETKAFGQLPKLSVASFTRVNVNDAIVAALCHNPKLYRFDADQAPITKRCIRHFIQCSRLRFVLLDRCPHFPKKYEPQLKERLSSVEIVRIK